MEEDSINYKAVLGRFTKWIPSSRRLQYGDKFAQRIGIDGK